MVCDTASTGLQLGPSLASPTVVKSHGQARRAQRCGGRQRQDHAAADVENILILEDDSSFEELLRGELAMDDYHKRNRFLREEGGLVYLGRLLYIPPQLRKHVMQEAHEPSYSGHLGVDKTCAGIKRRFWWPHVRKTVRRYITRCDECQHNKPRSHKMYGEMHPIPPPDRPWEQMTMDLVTGLPETAEGFDTLMVFVDRLTKMMRCVPTKKQLDAPATAHLFKEIIYRHFGLPEVIIADRDRRWNSLFWSSVFRSLQTKTRLSTAYHPQTDGQTERANRTLEEMLRSYIRPLGDDWDQKLCDMEFSYNNSENKSTGQTPFYLMYGFHPRTPIDLYNPAIAEPMPAAKHFVEQMLAGHQAAKAALEKAGAQQKEQYDRKRKESPFKKGDWVLLSSKDMKFQGRTDKLTKRFLGPYRIMLMSDDGLAATLRLPPSVHIHPTVHVSRIRAYLGDHAEDEEPKTADPEELQVEDEHQRPDTADLEIEDIIASRKVLATTDRRFLRNEFLVKWKGREESDNTWMKLSAIDKEWAQSALNNMRAGYLDEGEDVQKAH